MQSDVSNSNSIGSTTNENETDVESNKKSKQNVVSEPKFTTKSKSKKQIHPGQRNADLTESESQIDSEDESDILDVHSKSNLNDDRRNWWKESVTEYAFNLPTVRANLGRLVGTDEIKLNDHQFMMHLRACVWNDFDEKLTAKIKQREAIEVERSKQLILKSQYNLRNCPRKLLPLHSVILALDLQSEPIKTDNTVKTNQLSRHDPVFYINRRTNITVHLRRRKNLKSIRRSNLEYLMRRVLKEKLEYDESRVIQDKIKVIHDSISGKKQHLAFIARMICKVKSMLRRKNAPEQ